MPSKLPWTAIQDEYGNSGIVDADGEYIVEELSTVQELSIENADLIVRAVNATQQCADCNYEIGEACDNHPDQFIDVELAKSEIPKYVHQFRTFSGWDTVTEDDDVTPVTWTDKAEADREMDEFFGAIEQAVARGDMSEHNRADWRVAELGAK